MSICGVILNQQHAPLHKWNTALFISFCFSVFVFMCLCGLKWWAGALVSSYNNSICDKLSCACYWTVLVQGFNYDWPALLISCLSNGAQIERLKEVPAVTLKWNFQWHFYWVRCKHFSWRGFDWQYFDNSEFIWSMWYKTKQQNRSGINTRRETKRKIGLENSQGTKFIIIKGWNHQTVLFLASKNNKLIVPWTSGLDSGLTGLRWGLLLLGRVFQILILLLHLGSLGLGVVILVQVPLCSKYRESKDLAQTERLVANHCF